MNRGWDGRGSCDYSFIMYVQMIFEFSDTLRACTSGPFVISYQFVWILNGTYSNNEMCKLSLKKSHDFFIWLQQWPLQIIAFETLW